MRRDETQLPGKIFKILKKELKIGNIGEDDKLKHWRSIFPLNLLSEPFNLPLLFPGTPYLSAPSWPCTAFLHLHTSLDIIKFTKDFLLLFLGIDAIQLQPWNG